MTETPAAPPLSTFVVRFWRQRTVSGGEWRGRIEHLQSGEGTTFLTWQQMVAFVQRFGITAQGGDWEAHARRWRGGEEE